MPLYGCAGRIKLWPRLRPEGASRTPQGRSMLDMSPQVPGPLIGLAIMDAFLLFVVGMIVMQRVEMFIRARKVRAGGAVSHVEAVA